MSNYEFKTFPGEPIILGTLFSTFDTRSEMPSYVAELSGLFDRAREPVIYVNDLSAVQPSIEEIIQVSNQVSRGAGAVLHHPNLKMMVLITGSNLLKMAARGLNSTPFGFVDTHVFDSVDKALDFARSQV